MANVSWFSWDFPTRWEPPRSWENQDAGSPWQAESWSLGGPRGVQGPFFLCGLDGPLPFSMPPFPSRERERLGQMASDVILT